VPRTPVARFLSRLKGGDAVPFNFAFVPDRGRVSFAMTVHRLGTYRSAFV
jgi:hypothetical protein